MGYRLSGPERAFTLSARIDAKRVCSGDNSIMAPKAFRLVRNINTKVIKKRMIPSKKFSTHTVYESGVKKGLINVSFSTKVWVLF
jgi:hypothetical protein